MKEPGRGAAGHRAAARVPRRAGRRRAAVAQPGGDRLRRGRAALCRRVPRVQPVRRRSRRRTRASSRTGLHPDAGGRRRRRRLREEHAVRRRRADGDRGRLLGRRRLRRARRPTCSTSRTPTATARPTCAGSSSPGSARDQAGEGMLNSFRWGLDNRFHISTEPRRRLGAPRRSRGGAKTVSVRGYGFLLDPRGETFELTGGGGQHGMSIDDWGRTYVCGNSDPFHLVMYDSRYIARNPYLRAPAAAVNVAPAGKFTKLYRISPVEPWRALRTRLRSQGLVAGLGRGGHAVGLLHRRDRGDRLPRRRLPGRVPRQPVRRRGRQQPHPSRRSPSRRGVLVTARDAEPGREFLASRDSSFRPVQMANAPDGCLWVVDMCRELIEGAAFLPPQILKHMDVASGVDRGRIWRIVPDGHRAAHPQAGQGDDGRAGRPARAPQRLAPRHGLAAAVPAAGPVRRRGPAAARRRIEVARRPRPCALRAGRASGRSSRATSLAALGDPDPHVRAHALRLAEPFCRRTSAIREPDGGDGRRPRPDGPLPARVLARCAAGRPAPPRLWPRWRSATGPIPGCGWRSSAR